MKKKRKLSKKKMLALLAKKKFMSRKHADGNETGSFILDEPDKMVYITFTVNKDIENININMIPKKRRYQ